MASQSSGFKKFGDRFNRFLEFAAGRTATGSSANWRACFSAAGVLSAAIMQPAIMSAAADDGESVSGTGAAHMPPYIERKWQEDFVYFIMPDRFLNGDTSNDHGGIDGDKFRHGFDPSDKAFYHGGDLKGVIQKLDYLEELGVSAIWLSPIFKNKAVQGDVYQVSAGYHGYWVTDFTQIDPHLGTNDDLKALVDAAHARNMKVIFDIITNHTADVIKYHECHPEVEPGEAPAKAGACPYRSKADFPYTLHQGDPSKPINEGFNGDDVEFQTMENFDKLKDLTWAYTPYLPKGEEAVKAPAWLNDPQYYHNRGETTFEGESSLYGDFVSLDDVFTEHPRVMQGMIDIYKFWIEEFRIDGFRVDTVRHVNNSFWQKVSPALEAHARSIGIPEFLIFGEVFEPDPEVLSTFTRHARLPSVLDFGFQAASADVVARAAPTDRLRDFYAKDDYYTEAGVSGHSMPTFLGNHDMGRIGFFLTEKGGVTDRSLDQMTTLHALMFFSRGTPVVYYGDEQGFTGDGNDQHARENMQPSLVGSYNDNRHIGSDVSPAVDNFDNTHPLYKAIQKMARIRQRTPLLKHGAHIHRLSEAAEGVFAFSRMDLAGAGEVLFAMNSASEPRTVSVPVSSVSEWTDLWHGGESGKAKDGVLEVTVPASGFRILQATGGIEPASLPGNLDFAVQGNGSDRFLAVVGAFEAPAEVAFKVDGKNAGRDRSAPYRLLLDPKLHGQGVHEISATITTIGGETRTISRRVTIKSAE